MSKSRKKSVFITGGAGGLGGATARYLAERGWLVFAADFMQDALDEIGQETNIIPVFLDVTDPASVEAARDAVAKEVTGLNGVVNFAGILAVGSMIEMPEEALARVLDVNVMGTFRVNRALFDLVEKRKGRIVNISSETGWQSGMPFNGAYGMSKHAIEAYSDALRREANMLGVSVIKVQPGPFKTDMVASIESNFTKASEASKHFSKVLDKMKGLAMKEQGKAHDPQIIAQTIYTALTTSSPSPAYSVKPDPSRSMMNLLPDRVADSLLKYVLKV